jgi:transposase
MKKKHSPKELPTNYKDLRQRVVQHRKNNLSGFKIAAILLLAVSTVYNWLKLYKEKGKQTFKPQKRCRKVGSGRLLTPVQEEEIQHMITSSLPGAYDLNYSTQNRRAIVDLEKKKYGIEIFVRTIGDYLKR